MHFNDFKSDRYWTVVVLFALMLVVGGCGGQSKDKNVSPTDSIGETRSSGNMFETLPDTMFESAGRIRYDVEIIDSADQTLSSERRHGMDRPAALYQQVERGGVRFALRKGVFR